MIKSVYIKLGLLIAGLFSTAFAQDFNPCSGTLPKEILETRLSYLVKDPVLYQQIDILSSGIHLYAGPRTKFPVPEIILPLETANAFGCLLASESSDAAVRIYQSYAATGLWGALPDEEITLAERPDLVKFPLARKRIAIDPGHFASSLEEAKWERKYLFFRAVDIGSAKDISYFEADHNYVVARMVADSFMALGAQVMLTRKENETAFGMNYTRWYKEQRTADLKKALETGFLNETTYRQYIMLGEKDLMRKFFLRWDLKKRADSINAFHPDFTLSLHLNVEEKNTTDKSGYFSVIQDNYAMAFVHGAYAAGELNTVENRALFLRRLLNPMDAPAVELSVTLLDLIRDSLNVPLVAPGNTLGYLQQYSIPVTDAAGVYYRNLALLALLKDPCILMEPFLQDAATEIIPLASKDCTYRGKPVSCRLMKLAEIYITAVLRQQ